MMTFNNGKSIMAAIDAIAATSSKNEKEALIKAAGQSSTLFMKVLQYAYDPFKNYGISFAPFKTEGIAPGENKLEEAFVWKTLDDLVERKLTGGSARETVQRVIDLLDEHSAEVFRRIVNKDLRASFSEGTINRVFKGTFQEFPYMRCSLPDKSNMGKWDWSVGIISQEKADGMFANVNIDDSGFVWITSRAGTLFPAGCLQIEDEVKKALTYGYQNHGELTVYENGVLMPREKGNGVLNSLLSGGALEPGQAVMFEAWDQIPLSAVTPGGSYSVPYKTRLVNLLRQIQDAGSSVSQVRVIPTRIVKSKAEAYAHYRELLKKGKEGTICKSPDAIWKDTTSKDQVKLKLEVDVELRIKEIIPGTPGTKNEGRAGSFLCVSECGKLETGVTVKNEKLRDEVDANPDAFVGEILTVRANSIMAPEEGDEAYSLFLPRMVEQRKDKSIADDLDKIQSIFKNAMEGSTV